MSQPIAPPAVSFGRRLAAFLLDAVLSDLVALLFSRPDRDSWGWVVLLVFAVEVWVLTGLAGSSAGQRLLGVAVVRGDGRAPGLLRAAARTLLLLVLVPVFLVDRAGRGLHDRTAGTFIVRVGAAS